MDFASLKPMRNPSGVHPSFLHSRSEHTWDRTAYLITVAIRSLRELRAAAPMLRTSAKYRAEY